jgi:hypothetical protein
MIVVDQGQIGVRAESGTVVLGAVVPGMVVFGVPVLSRVAARRVVRPPVAPHR